MRLKWFLMACICFGPAFSMLAQEEEPAFREPLYLSDFDRDLRTPQAVRVGGVVFVSALSGPGETAEAQLKVAYIRLQSVLGNYGMRLSDVAQEKLYVLQGVPFALNEETRSLRYREEGAPVLTIVRVPSFETPGQLIGLEAVAVAGAEE